MFYFVRRYGKYWNGGDPQYESAWQAARKGAVTFQTAREARQKIHELGLEGAEPEAF